MNLLVIENENITRGAAISLRILLRNLKLDYNVNITVMQVNENENILFYDSLGINHFAGGHSSFAIEYKNNISKLRLLWRLFKKNIKVKRNNKIAYEHLKNTINIKDIDLVYTNLDRYSIGHLINKREHIPHVVHLREFGDIDFGVVSSIPDHHRKLDYYVSQYIAISNAVKEHYIRFGIESNKISVIYNGVENVYYPKNKTATMKDDLKIVVVGAMIPAKGQLNVVEALALLPEEIRKHIQTDFWGDGDSHYINQIQQMAENANVKAVLKGRTNTLNVILPEYDVGIICSRAEAFGRVTIEYMMAGLYVIASNTGANPELIGTETNQLYAWNNPKDLARHIQWVFENRDEADKIAKKFIPVAKELYNDKTNAKNIYELMDKIIKQRKTSDTKILF